MPSSAGRGRHTGRSARPTRPTASSGPRQRREVVVAEERRLSPARSPRLEDVGAEDLRDPGRRRHDRPGDERADDDLGVAPRAHEQRHGQRQQPVFGELRRRDRMRRRVVARGPELRVDAARGHVQEEDPAGDPDRPPGAERREAAAQAADQRRDAHRQQHEVGEHDVLVRSPRVHREAGLVVDVQEQDRERRRQHHRGGQRHAQGPPCRPSRTWCGRTATGGTLLRSPKRPARMNPRARLRLRQTGSR